MVYSIVTSGGTNNTTVPLAAVGNATYGDPQIQNLHMGKETQIMKIPIPTEDSNKTIGFDLLGVVREINIDGLVTGTVTEMGNFVRDLEEKLNGDQYNKDNLGHTFNTDFAATGTTSYNVIIKAFTWDYKFGVPGKVTYRLALLEVSNS